LNKSKPHETDIEKLMREELERRKIEFFQFYPHRLGFVMDFGFLEKKICVECDGEKWHLNKRKDNFRDFMLRRSGWKTLRFSGIEIKNDIDSCVNKIDLVLR